MASIYAIGIYLVVLIFRLSFSARWDHPELWVAGERILSTHDAYFWLAKAKGVGMDAGYPLAQAAKLFNSMFGLGLGEIGFWSPAVMGALVGLLCFMWGYLLSGRDAGVFAGVVGSLTPGFYYRTRLGYFDTDMFTLLVPMVVAWCLAFWISRHIKSGWFTDIVETDSEVSVPDLTKSLWTAFVIGLVARFGCIWHQDLLNLNIIIFLIAAVLVLINGRRGQRAIAFYGLIVFLLAAFPGTSFDQVHLAPFSRIIPNAIASTYLSQDAITGILLALLFAVGVRQALPKVPQMRLWYVWGGLFALTVFLTGLIDIPVSNVYAKLIGYLTPAGNGAVSSITSNGPIYPSILQSIIEAKLVGIETILERGAFSFWLGALALICVFVVVALRPAAVLLVPLVLLHLLSMKMGIRFTMFGGAALMLCLGVCLHWVVAFTLKRGAIAKYGPLVGQITLAIGVLFFAYNGYSSKPLTPVLSRQHAEALRELGQNYDRNSMVWTWWDWGYATQYFAELETTVDGGKHAGRDVYPTALVLGGQSLHQANQMVLVNSRYKADAFHLGYDVAAEWAKMSGQAVQDQVEKMKTSTVDSGAEEHQFVVVTWKDLTIAKWITYFGNWNLETGETNAATIANYDPGQLGFNVERGAVMNRQGKGGLVSDITILSPEGVEKKEYYLNRMSPQLLPNAEHLVINNTSRQSVLMDRIGYRSTMRRLLTDDPNDPEISKYFKLVVDKLPFVRIYEVVQ